MLDLYQTLVTPQPGGVSERADPKNTMDRLTCIYGPLFKTVAGATGTVTSVRSKENTDVLSLIMHQNGDLASSESVEITLPVRGRPLLNRRDPAEEVRSQSQ
jgi:hypothetical protein